jgi:hypothetical protein
MCRQTTFFVVPCIVQRITVETPLFMVVIMESLTVRRIRV